MSGIKKLQEDDDNKYMQYLNECRLEKSILVDNI